MSLSGGLRALARRDVQNVIRAADIFGPGGLSAAGTVPEELARKLSAVDACIEILSNSLSKLPSYVMDRERSRPQHEILELLNVRPNEAMTPSVRKKLLESSRLTTGNSYDWIIRDPRSLRPKELIPIPGQLCTPWRDTHGRIWYDVTHPVSGEIMRLASTEVCHYKGPTRDGLNGLSVLQRASEVIACGRAAQGYERSFYERGGQPSGVLATDTDLTGWAKDSEGKLMRDPDGSAVSQKEQLRREWEKVHNGPSNAHRIAILDLGLKYTPLAGSNRDAQFVESRAVSVTDIARFFGVPLYKLQEGKQSYESNEQNSIEYVVSTLHPIVTQYEEEQTYKLLPPGEVRKGLEIRINMMAELRGDSKSRGEWYRTMRDIGVYSVNDIRALEDVPDVEGGDDRQASLNYVPLVDWKRLSEQRNGGNNP